MAARAADCGARADTLASYVVERAAWDTPAGRQRLRDIVVPRVSYTPDVSQIDLACTLLSGKGVLLIKPTGGGKTTLISYTAMAEPNTITLVCSPLNLLEENMVDSLSKQAVTALALNSDSLSDARNTGRDLVAEARIGKYQVILMSPEMFLSALFTRLVEDKLFRDKLRRFIVDECHIILLWKSLRPKYAFLGDMRSLLPDHVTFAAMTATLPCGEPTAQILRTLGFRTPNFVVERHDCQRYDIDLFIRTLSHGIGGHDILTFPDLDWLVPPDLSSAADAPKTLVYCNSIELGYRVTSYLRSLLPPTLSANANRLITLVHGLSCPHCKADALETLLEAGAERRCAVHVATDVLAMGIDVSDIERVVCFGTPDSLSTMLQHIGRAARERGRRGAAYVYINQTDMKRARAEAERADYDDVPVAHGRGKKRAHPAVEPSTSTPATDTANTTCLALDRVLVAAVSNTCVNVPINIAMGNENTAPDYKCNACSSCLGDDPPDPRFVETAADDTLDGTGRTVPSATVAADIAPVVSALNELAFTMWSRTTSVEDVSSTVFLSSKWVSAIATRLGSLTSEDAITDELKDWRHWHTHGDKLGRAVLANRRSWLSAVATAKADRLKKARAAVAAKKKKSDKEVEQLLVRRARAEAAQEAEREALADASNVGRVPSNIPATGSRGVKRKRYEEDGDSDEEWTPDGGARAGRQQSQRTRAAGRSQQVIADNQGQDEGEQTERRVIEADKRVVVSAGKSSRGRKRRAVIYDKENL